MAEASINRAPQINRAAKEQKTESSGVIACILLFFLFSFVGWCMEKAWFYLAYGVNADRGFLRLPFCTVYGSGLLLIRMLLGFPRLDKPYPKNILYLALYAFLSALIATIAELSTGLVFEDVFHVRLWSYRGYPHTYTDYVCLPMSCAWGLLTAAVMPLVWAPLERRLKRADGRFLFPVALVLTLSMIADFLFVAGSTL